jgi:hypothetical protein
MTFIDNRSPREKLQEEFIGRIIDGMDTRDLVAYAYDSLSNFYNEMTDEDLTTAVKEIYPDYFDETEENS